MTLIVISFSAAIYVCEKGGQWEQALSLLDKMRWAGMTLNVISFSAAICTCEKGGHWERAFSMLNKITRCVEQA